MKAKVSNWSTYLAGGGYRRYALISLPPVCVLPECSPKNVTRTFVDANNSANTASDDAA